MRVSSKSRTRTFRLTETGGRGREGGREGGSEREREGEREREEEREKEKERGREGEREGREEEGKKYRHMTQETHSCTISKDENADMHIAM